MLGKALMDKFAGSGKGIMIARKGAKGNANARRQP